MSEPILEARRMWKRFGPTEALRGADLTVAAGETVAVIGASGSGKSTLLYCLAGILVPDDGEVWFAGQPHRRPARAGALGAAPAPVRLRLPVRPARARAHRARERRPAAAARGGGRTQARERAAQWLERLGRGDSGRCPTGRAVGWSGPAGGDRAGARRPTRRSCSPTSPPGSLDSVARRGGHGRAHRGRAGRGHDDARRHPRATRGGVRATVRSYCAMARSRRSGWSRSDPPGTAPHAGGRTAGRRAPRPHGRGCGDRRRAGARRSLASARSRAHVRARRARLAAGS